MDSVSAFKPVHRSWIALTAKTLVVPQLLAIVYRLTSIWVTLAVAAVFVAVVLTVKALSRASRQVDQIFEEELG